MLRAFQRYVACIWTQINRGNSQLLMVGNQIDTLTPNPSFGHNLCFKYPNASCEPILNIYIPKDFQWCKEHFNPMSFDPCYRLLKIWESIGTPIPKVGVHLGMWGFILHIFRYFQEHEHDSWLHSWLTPLQALALITNPRLGLWQYTIKKCVLVHSGFH